jgi:hypothetical protein
MYVSSFAALFNTILSNADPEQLTEADKSTENQWDQVDDFKWLKTTQSPNWITLSEAQRLDDEVWTKIVQGNPGVSVEGILSKVGIPQK